MLPFKYVVFLALLAGLFMLSLFYVWKQNMINQNSNSVVTCSTTAEHRDTAGPTNMPFFQYSAEAGLGVLLEEAPEQQLFPQTVLMKAVKFMIEERNQYDEELVAFVKSLILPPPKTNLYIRNGTKEDVSQYGQSRFMDNVLGSKRNGFFIEAGAWDGELLSNSLFFELERNWTGLLVEPIPSNFQKAVKKRRRAFLLNSCVAGEHVIVAKIRVAEALSGRVASMKDTHQQRIENEFGKKRPHVYIPCFPLNTILRAMGVRNIDYFSLDIEGGELDVLRSVDFAQFSIQSLTVEYNGYQDILTNLISLMVTKLGYKSLKQDGTDLFLVKENKNGSTAI